MASYFEEVSELKYHHFHPHHPHPVLRPDPIRFGNFPTQTTSSSSSASSSNHSTPGASLIANTNSQEGADLILTNFTNSSRIE